VPKPLHCFRKGSTELTENSESIRFSSAVRVRSSMLHAVRDTSWLVLAGMSQHKVCGYICNAGVQTAEVVLLT
jgi:hypothetical protein